MFDIAWSELLIIGIVALIFIGPKELPQALYALGKLMGKVRNTADEFRKHFETSMREAGYEDLHKNIRDLHALNPANQIKQTLQSVMTEDPSPKPSPSSEKNGAERGSEIGLPDAPGQSEQAAGSEALGVQTKTSQHDLPHVETSSAPLPPAEPPLDQSPPPSP